MKMRDIFSAVGTLAVLLSTCGANAQNAAPIIHDTFEETAGAWQAIGPTAKANTTQDAGNVKEGKGALKFDYEIAKGGMNLLMTQTPAGQLEKMRSLRFWVKADHSAMMAVILQEKEGGRYVAGFMAPADKWQRVELAASDFNLSAGNDDPKDPDGKLDLDKVEMVGITDVGQFMAQIDNVEISKIFSFPKGPHSFYLDEFLINEEALPASSESDGNNLNLDKSIRPQVNWFSLGEATLSRSQGKPLEGSAIRVDYRQTPGKLMGLMRTVTQGKLANKKQIVFEAASQKPMTLIVQVETPEGAKHSQTIEIAGGSEKKTYTLNFANFQPAQDSKGDRMTPDMKAVHQIILLDPAGLSGAVDQDNTLWIGSLHFVGK